MGSAMPQSRRRRRDDSWNKRKGESVLGAYSYIEESARAVIRSMAESTPDSAAWMRRKGGPPGVDAVEETNREGDHAFSDGDRANTCDNHHRLGKIPAETANHGHRAFFHRPRAKNSDALPPLGKILEKPPIMATTLSWTTIALKPAIGSGKISVETANHGHSQEHGTAAIGLVKL